MKRTHQALVVVAAGLLAVSLSSSAASAASCIKAGGWGTGALQGVASFMAQAAMKNSAKAKLGDSVRIGKVRERCELKGLLYECTAFARACR
jgi:hypothetical protein